MNDFNDRYKELEDFDQLLQVERGKFIWVTGHHQVGKTSLLLKWAYQTGRALLYWKPSSTLNSLLPDTFEWKLDGWMKKRRIEPVETSRMKFWDAFLRQLALYSDDQPFIFIFDNFDLAIKDEPALDLHLQFAWDHLLKNRNITIVLVCSEVKTINALLGHRSLLNGRLSGGGKPTPFPIPDSLWVTPWYSVDDWFSIYSVIGGYPGYITKLNTEISAEENIDLGFFRFDGPFFQQAEEIYSGFSEEDLTYKGILSVLAEGHYSLGEITSKLHTLISKVAPLLELLVHEELVTVRPSALEVESKREDHHYLHYFLSHPLLRFYLKFVLPHRERVLSNQIRWKKDQIFDDFVATTTFPELCQYWVRRQAEKGKFIFRADHVGSQWEWNGHFDVVAISKAERKVFLADCVWDKRELSEDSIATFLKITNRQITEEGWQVFPGIFTKDDLSLEEKLWLEKQDVIPFSLTDIGGSLFFGNKHIPF